MKKSFPLSSSSPKSPDGYRFAILALTVKLWLAVLCARLLKGRWLFVGLACCHGGSPIAVPPRAGPTAIATGGHLSVSQSGAFPNCATRFRGGALRHAKFPKTSYKVQLLDTLKHAACVFREPAKGKPFVGRGATEHILPDAQIFVRLKYVSVGTSGRRRGLIFLSKKVLNFFFTLFNFFPITLFSSTCL